MTDTVASLKKWFQREVGIPVDRQLLCVCELGGVSMMEDGDTLSDHNIEDGSVIEVDEVDIEEPQQEEETIQITFLNTPPGTPPLPDVPYDQYQESDVSVDYGPPGEDSDSE
eukprot:3360232-Heterocapsa_arctica.AAC.1